MTAALTLLVLLGCPAPSPEIAQGTTVRLRLETSLSTRTARAGDPVRLYTVGPAVVDGRAIPAGSEVRGVVTRSIRPGRVLGRGAIEIQIASIEQPDGTMLPVTASPSLIEPPQRLGPRRVGPRPPPVLPILAGMAAGYGTAMIVARASNSAETIARSGVVAGLTMGVLVGVLERGEDFELRAGYIMDVVLRWGRS